MSDATNISTAKPGVAGVVHIADSETALPTDAITALGTSFTSLGYVSEDGITVEDSPESEPVKEMGGQTVDTINKGRNTNITFTLIESLNINVLKAVYGDANVSGNLASGISISVGTDDMPEKVWAFDMILKGGAKKRIVIPAGKISEIGETIYKGDEVVGYEITIMALLDSAGKTHYQYIEGASASV